MKVFLIIHVVCGIIYYDSNIFTKYAQSKSGGSRCTSPYSREETIYFSDSFLRPPKLIIQTELMDLSHPSINHTIEIKTITTQYFILHQQCYYSIIYGIAIRWQAIDDERIQIINEFNMNSIQNKTYSHINSNAEKAILSLLHVSYKGPIQFDIMISDLTTTNVSVVITDPNNKLQNLVMLGYQIILGVEEAITAFSTINTTAIYTSPHYSLQANSWFVTPYIGFSYNVADNVRLDRTYYTDSQSIYYSIHTLINGQYYAPQKHQPAWIKYQFTTIFTALECRTIRITQIKEIQAFTRNSFEVEILERNQVLNTQNTFQVILDKSFQIINMKIYSKCFSNKTIKSYFNKCNDCLENQQHKFSHNCYGAINTINFSIRLTPTIQAYQELIIIISNTDCQVYQLLFNQEQSQVKLVDIKQVDTL